LQSPWLLDPVSCSRPHPILHQEWWYSSCSPNKMREKLFKEAHGGRCDGHRGEARVYSELNRHYWWPVMRKDIALWNRGCLVCGTYNPGWTMRPPITVVGPFDCIGIDIIQFPRSHDGNQYAIVIMDYLTKWPEVLPVSDQSAATIAKVLVEEIVSRHGVPAEILSDRGRASYLG